VSEISEERLKEMELEAKQADSKMELRSIGVVDDLVNAVKQLESDSDLLAGLIDCMKANVAASKHEDPRFIALTHVIVQRLDGQSEREALAAAVAKFREGRK
jgi:hypothetical protein